MFFAIIGPISSGKKTIANYLIEKYNFSEIYLQRKDEVKNEPLNLTTTNVIDYCNKKTTIGKEIIKNENAIVFNDIQELLNFVTCNWYKNYVLSSECIASDLLLLKKRPTFLLISVNAPIMKRYQRFIEKFNNENGEAKNLLSLEEFCELDDTQMFERGLNSIMNKSDLKIENARNDIEEFYKILDEKQLTKFERLRPSWDTYFMTLSFLTARQSSIRITLIIIIIIIKCVI